ncbi:hypothetical protein H6P81_000310 [Aristolochia fimbriata]|uniref:Uncharacterized protein n=1 Tax=Aristolochia fimbriata TaxID=158543 RepID=A0AAV7F730_ARIFI|nr:hypothetical protein H6P81_000310 [Aristolochia fimbriata]
MEGGLDHAQESHSWLLVEEEGIEEVKIHVHDTAEVEQKDRKVVSNGHSTSKKQKRFSWGHCLDNTVITIGLIALTVICYEITVLSSRQSQASGDEYENQFGVQVQHWRPWRPVTKLYLGENDEQVLDYRPLIMTDDENANEPFDDPYNDEYDEVEEDDDKETTLSTAVPAVSPTMSIENRRLCVWIS